MGGTVVMQASSGRWARRRVDRPSAGDGQTTRARLVAAETAAPWGALGAGGGSGSPGRSARPVRRRVRRRPTRSAMTGSGVRSPGSASAGASAPSVGAGVRRRPGAAHRPGLSAARTAPPRACGGEDAVQPEVVAGGDDDEERDDRVGQHEPADPAAADHHRAEADQQRPRHVHRGHRGELRRDAGADPAVDRLVVEERRVDDAQTGHQTRGRDGISWMRRQAPVVRAIALRIFG